MGCCCSWCNAVLMLLVLAAVCCCAAVCCWVACAGIPLDDACIWPEPGWLPVCWICPMEMDFLGSLPSRCSLASRYFKLKKKKYNYFCAIIRLMISLSTEMITYNIYPGYNLKEPFLLRLKGSTTAAHKPLFRLNL